MKAKHTCKDCRSKLVGGKNWIESAKNNGQYLCKPCMTARTTRTRRAHKARGIEYLGGKCFDCHGVFHEAIYDFHHTNPKQKDTQPSRLFGNRWETLQQELDKCVLLCANCHRLRHFIGEERKLNPRKRIATPERVNYRRLRDINTGRVFLTQEEAAQCYGVEDQSISNWVRGIHSSKQGIQLEYV